MNLISKSALVIIRDNKLLVVRKRGTALYLMPGGKIRAGETPEQSLFREIYDEISCELIGNDLQFFGEYEDVAANEFSTRVNIRLFTGQILGEPKANTEIEDILWFGLNDSPALLS